MPVEFSKKFTVANRKIGQDQPVFIVAEAGVAHFGSIKKAKALVDLAVTGGADAIKFQIFKTEALITKGCKKWIERLKPKELPFDAFREISSCCKEKGIIFFATAHDEVSLEFLDDLKMPVYKIGSGEVDNWAFLKQIAARGKPVILSTGMYTLEKIGYALEAFAETENPDIAVLHCVTQYPTPPTDVNLLAIETIRKKFGVIVGYSDHTQGFHFPLAAVAFGAKIIEKHITLDFNVPNAQDWKVSCGSHDFSLMVQQIREIEAGLGTGVKMPSQGELSSIVWARKSLVAAKEIQSGEIVSLEKVVFKRPGTGISPAEVHLAMGRKVKVDIAKDHVIKWEHLV